MNIWTWSNQWSNQWLNQWLNQWSNRWSNQWSNQWSNLRQLIPAAVKTWLSNQTIRYTYAIHTSQGAWAYIDGLGWRRIRTGSPDGVSNVFRVCCEAQASSKKVNAYVDDVYLYNVIAL